jgi:HAD superfamily hydrolase (TIGR01509 family)
MTSLDAVFFDQDGVIIDTERDGHRVAFNRTFEEFGFADQWDGDYYHQLLQIGGGKERMRHHWQTRGFSRPVPETEIDALVKEMHKRKTEIFIEMIEAGQLPLRPGVHRFMREAMQAGLKLAVCTTSNERSAKAITEKMLPDIRFDLVLAGDVVSKKKPDPEIYLLALSRLGLTPQRCFVVEDSRIGVLAGKGAGLKVLVTTNAYTEQEDVSSGDIVVTCLGDPGGEKGTLQKGDFPFDGVLHVEQVVQYFSAA